MGKTSNLQVCLATQPLAPPVERREAGDCRGRRGEADAIEIKEFQYSIFERSLVAEEEEKQMLLKLQN